ncbi:hypothetical protein A9Q68_07270 [Streptococcus bovimastitidis]|uniref:Sensor histidine kinase NatK-like C-terminal domain-containing protein n=2 Tax=Streptococcus bovimastitidis TaxID=1856638 RepID=A0A1L8MM19_9STRE|nr:hypothetical protein A9Q68_07270 [Streptococcus bovimastitidis]
MEEIFYSVTFYFLLYFNLLLIFQDISKVKVRKIESILFIFLSGLCSYFLDNFSLIIDPIYLLIFSFVIRPQFSWSKHIFYSFFAVTNIELSSRIIYFLFIPVITNQTLDKMTNHLWYIHLVYLLILPYYFFIKAMLHIDYEKIRLANDKSENSLFKPLNISMIIVFVLVQGLIFIENNFKWFVAYDQNLKYYIILVYMIIFLIGIRRLNDRSLTIINEEVQANQSRHFKHLSEYNVYLEKLYHEISSFKDDTRTSLERFEKIAQTEDLDKIKAEYNTIFTSIDNPFRDHHFDLDRLVNISIPTVKSFMAAKLFEAQSAGVSVSVEVPDVIRNIPMKLIDFIIIISVFFDNAIDAAKESDVKEISLAFFCQNDTIIFLLENSNKVERINISQVFQEGYSTKGENRGIGLANVKKILEQYPYTTIVTKSGDYHVSQRLEMIFSVDV